MENLLLRQPFEEALAGLLAICREKMWPLLKNFAKMGFDETRETANHRTSRFLQLFFSSACVQDDPQYARLFASGTQSGKSMGISSH